MADETAPAPAQETPDPAETRTLLWIAVALVAIPAACVAILSYTEHWHWLPNLWFNYAWPSDKGNGPEALQQTILYAAIAVVLVPAVRRWLGAEFHKVHAKIDTVHATVIAHHEESKAEREELHAHMAHLAHHLDVPAFERKEQP